MNDTVRFTVLDSREVARMVEKEHPKLLRDIRGYIENMLSGAESKIGFYSESLVNPNDFFIEGQYKGENGKSNPCYNITRKGCEFIANKLTGKKGTLFTASYINKFHELENRQIQLQQPYDTAKAFSLGEVSNLLKLLVTVMDKQNSTGHEIAKQVKVTCEQFGIHTIANFVKPLPYEQLSLPISESGR